MPGAMTSTMPAHASAFGRSPQTTKPLSVANRSAGYRNGGRYKDGRDGQEPDLERAERPPDPEER